MHMGDGPISVMGKRVNALDCQCWPFESRHSVSGDRHNHELEHGFLSDLIPCTAKREQPIQHAAPRWRDQHDRKNHSQRLCPVRKSCVEQMMGASPNIDKYQCPKMNYREP